MNTNNKKNLWIVLLVAIAAILAFILVYVANRPKEDTKQTTQSNTQQESSAQPSNKTDLKVFTKLVKAEKFDPSSVKELKVEELKAGTGDTVSETDTISANYTGWNASGTIFDSTKKSATTDPKPIEFPLSGVIPGWTKGLSGKKVGGIYKLMIPANMAYGDNAPSKDVSGPLAFVVEIVAKK
ncbi:MAG: FKBP-type peptidyl-prolyl cis-trans isomerase [Lactococcus plantarum]|nr:FKBP-type peptidyl-prolyl cis-trans isomerase [Lactococcus plantarum]